MKKIGVYGSLRIAEYNYERFKKYFGDGINYLETTMLYGYDLFDLGAYPGIKTSDNPNKELVIDILEVSDECFQAINAMELGAGYSAIETKIGDHEITFYTYRYEATNKVESGNWSAYLACKRLANIREMYDCGDIWD